MAMANVGKQDAPVKRRRRSRANGDEPDALERQIIGLLQQEGRMANTALAERLNVSEGTIRRRLHRLLMNNAMNVVAVPNWRALGYGAEALVGLTVDLNQMDAVASKLEAMPQVQWVMTVTGPYDIFCSVVAESTSDLAKFLEANVASIAGIRTTQTFLSLNTSSKQGPKKQAA